MISFLGKLIPQPLLESDRSTEEQEMVTRLARLGLVAKSDNMVHLQFPCFTIQDYESMKESIQSVAECIIAALREVWSEIKKLVNQIDSDSHVPIGEKMYIILGCMILDWLSLGWLSDNGIIYYMKQQPNGEKFLLQCITHETRARNFSRFCYSATSGTDEWNYTVFGQATKSRIVTPEIEMRS
ncbi:MAG: hypothetical protein GF411_15855 [Candidatus Lokiarchaeota archaeon]|nr:hypothetical protein [Candidatus Lokiarchaeota archaeon]